MQKSEGGQLFPTFYKIIANFSFRCSGSQIEISIMKSVSEDQFECFLIYDHDDLTHLDIEINFFEKIIFGAQN